MVQCLISYVTAFIVSPVYYVWYNTKMRASAKANENKIVGALGLFSLIVFDAFIGC